MFQSSSRYRFSGNFCLTAVLAILMMGAFAMTTHECFATSEQISHAENAVKDIALSNVNKTDGQADINAQTNRFDLKAEQNDKKVLQVTSNAGLVDRQSRAGEKIQERSAEYIDRFEPEPKHAHEMPGLDRNTDLKKERVPTKRNEPQKSEIVKEVPKVRGYAFVESIIAPLNYELNERFWGWRPNDIINFTDNVNNIQLGVLEVTRRTVVILAYRISRTGSNDIIDENIENAMNWLMVKAKQYWFPSPETKYNMALDELRLYMDRLERGRASFFIRTDNLIPLLENFENLLGGCDQSLTMKEDEDGPVSSFRADNYFYYAQGVAMAMESIFKGIRKDFYVTLESVHGLEILDDAIEACEVATNINPWVVTEGSLSSILANHRANIGQPINRIRFYMDVLIRTLKGY